MYSRLQSLCNKYEIPLTGYEVLTGGDINNVFLLHSGSNRWVIKMNHSHAYPGMFEAEVKGLSILRGSMSFRIPEIIAVGNFEGQDYLLMEYLPSETPDKNFWLSFAENLAVMHQVSQPNFGLDHDNYIGRLPQYNIPKDTAASFYIEQRLEPQFRWARDKGYSFRSESLYKNLEDEIPNEPPALVHGDLWSGNYLAAESGDPALIDPAVAFASREMDLGMMQLFGGFPDMVFSLYDDLFPLEPDWKKRIEIWQLYYLLVHLNLFGEGYYGQVKNIVDTFS